MTELMAEIMAPQFWTGLMAIIWVNIILSGDNAVVIALAARALPEKQQKHIDKKAGKIEKSMHHLSRIELLRD